MDTRSGEIYPSALAAGVPEKRLVTGSREALEPLSRLVKRRNAAHAKKQKARARAKREQQAASRKANR
jgi:hypothetical protein